MINTHQRRVQRLALVDWMADDGYSHALTLNTDRELASSKLKQIFSMFCHIFDKAVLRQRNMKSMPNELRLRAIAFPENLSTNAHLHAFADLSPASAVMGDEDAVMGLLEECWLKATRGAGSFDHKAEPDEGWGFYITKKFTGEYFLTSDFHPH